MTDDTLDAPAQPAVPESTLRPGQVVVHTYEHFGRTQHQLMIVVGAYVSEVHTMDPKTHQVAVSHQPRVRMLPLGSAHTAADLPEDQVTPTEALDWEHGL